MPWNRAGQEQGCNNSDGDGRDSNQIRNQEPQNNMSTETLAPRANNGALATVKPSATFGDRGIVINQYDELVRFAQTVAASGLAPKGMEKPESIFVAVQMGLEVGLPPMASLQNIAVINGRPAIWGDAQLAVCRGTGEMEIFEEWYEVGGKKTLRNPQNFGDDVVAVCRVKRSGGQEIESAFSVADAKRANLWGKAGPWTQYPSRMLRNRARSFALRDAFGDALKGFRSVEEMRDTPPERDVTPVATAGPNLASLPKASDKPAQAPEAPAVQGNKSPVPANGAQGDPAPVSAPDVMGVSEGAGVSHETKPEPETLTLDDSPLTPRDILRDAMAADHITLTDLRAVTAKGKLGKPDFARVMDIPDALVQTLLDNWQDVLTHCGKGGE